MCWSGGVSIIMEYVRPVLCRLCHFPTPDGGVPVSQVDIEKLSEWCLHLMDTELDQEGLGNAVICNLCVWQARFLDENCELSKGSSFPNWWKQQDNFCRVEQAYFLDDVIQPCAVTIPEMKKDLLKSHGLLADSGRRQTPRRGQQVISNCVYCSAQLESQTLLIRHVEEEHKNDSTFACNQCRIFFLTDKEKETHREKYHRGLLFKCTHCTRGFSSLQRLIHHLKVEHNRKIIRCKYRCSAYFKNKKMRNEHIQEVHEPETKVACIYCKKFYRKDLHFGHMKLHHKSIYIKCNFVAKCNSFFHTEEEKEKHILDVHINGTDRLQCFYCQESVLRDHYSEHVKKKHDLVMIKCHYFLCATYFHTQKDKQKHILEVHESGSGKKRCIYCQKMFQISNKVFLEHVQERHKNVAIRCDYRYQCSNHFFLTQEEKQKHILEVHETDQNRVRCKFCPLKVSIKCMVSHIKFNHRSESKDDGYFVKAECIYCKSQMKKVCLASHMRRMHKTEAIKCNFNKNRCSTFFLTLEDRQKHIEQVHLTAIKGSSEVRCCFCNNVFSYKTSLKAHIKKRHPEAIKCSLPRCCEFFSTKEKQEEHFKKKHNEKVSVFRCFYCTFASHSKEEREAHYANFHNEETILCPKCPKVVRSKLALKKHITTVHGPKRECPHCKNQVATINWAHHLQSSTCQGCKVVFSCRALCTRHPRWCIRGVKK